MECRVVLCNPLLRRPSPVEVGVAGRGPCKNVIACCPTGLEPGNRSRRQGPVQTTGHWADRRHPWRGESKIGFTSLCRPTAPEWPFFLSIKYFWSGILGLEPEVTGESGPSETTGLMPSAGCVLTPKSGYRPPKPGSSFEMPRLEVWIAPRSAPAPLKVPAWGLFLWAAPVVIKRPQTPIS